MARIPRSKIIDELVPGIYHVYSRTVRQTFLFGEDAVTGRSYGHRLDLLRDAVRTLSRLFAIDVIGFGFMLNHFHEILRNRPDLVRKMSNYQVALRTCLLNELGMNLKVVGQERTPRQRASLRRKVEALMRDPKRLAKARAALSSISRYEQRLKGTIARLANVEDGVTGHFWSGRFESIPITNPEHLLVAMVYVDLNPVRAGAAETPEDSRYTSAYERIHGLKARLEWTEATANQDGLFTPEQRKAIEPFAENGEVRQLLDDWLSPIDERREALPLSGMDWLEPMVDEGYELWQAPEPIASEAPRESQAASDQPQQAPLANAVPDVAQLPPRASNKGCLPMTVCEYLQVLDWTGRQIHPEKAGQIPADLPPILERMGISEPKSWFDTFTEYGQKLAKAFSAPINQALEGARCVVNTCRGTQPLPEALL
jgi:REP element-mobilizing transposase RayT